MKQRLVSSNSDYVQPEVDNDDDQRLLSSPPEDDWARGDLRQGGRYHVPKFLRDDPRMPKPFHKTRCCSITIILCALVICGLVVIRLKDVVRIARLRYLGIPPGLYSRDGVLYVGENTPFMIKGLSWYGMEGDGRVPGGLNKVTVDSILSFARKNEFNAIRLPLSVENIINNNIVQSNLFKNPDISGLRYMDVVKAITRKAADYDLLILLDMHRLENHEVKSAGLWYSKTMPEERLFTVWKQLCQHVGEEWNVLGADVFNEPWDSLWNSSDKSVDWKQASERVGNLIHENCPSWTIFIEGVGERAKSTKTSPFWAENLHAVQIAPPELKLKNKVVLSPHVYGPSVHPQKYFKDKDFPRNMPSIWDDHFGEANQVTKLATVIGEWGGFYKGEDQKWQETFFKYIEDRKFSFFYWCLNPESVDTGGLLEGDWTTPEQRRLTLLQSAVPTSVDSCSDHFKHWRQWRN